MALTGPIVIDTSPPFTTQGTLSHGVRDGKWFNFTLDLENGFPSDSVYFTGSRALFYNASTRHMLPGQVLAVTQAFSIVPLGGSNWRVSVSFHANPTLTIPNGALCALAPTYGGPAVQITNSTRLSASDITSYGASGFTLLEYGGEGNHTYTRLNVTRRPGSSRLMASTADVFHSTAVAKGPTLEGSELSYAGDDLFAVHCELGVLWQRLNDTLYYIWDTGGGEFGLPQGSAGDALNFYAISANMTRLRSGVLSRVLESVRNSTIVAEAQSAAEKLQRDFFLRKFNVTVFIAHLEPPGLDLGDLSALVELPSRCGAGAVVSNSYLHDTNGGMRIKGSRTTVVNTTLEYAYGIRMLPELYWTQSVSSDVLLENNTLRWCGCTTLAPHAIEYNPDIVGLKLVNNTVYPSQCI